MYVLSRLRLSDHPPSHGLCQEIWPLQVDGKYPIETFFGCIKKVSTHCWSDAGIVNQHIQAAELVVDRPQRDISIHIVAHICLYIDWVDTGLAQRSQKRQNFCDWAETGKNK